MKISEIKNSLEITAVAEQLGIKIDVKSKRALCPFHSDKTPSLQFSKEKQIATCFSANCNAGTMDVIGLTEKKLQKTTHETLKYLSQLAGEQPTEITQQEPSQFKDVATLKKVFSYFETAFLGSKPAKDYATSRNLNIKTLTIGYNTGTFHHGENKSLVENALQLGLLNKTNSGYAPFGLGSLVFALRDKQHQVTGMYFRAVEPRPSKFKGRKYEKHLYLKNRTGLYPKYPGQETKKLILTESIIDAATLKEHLKNDAYEILACYGTNGFTQEHSESIKELEQLEEIIFWLDGDEAGRKSVEKYSKELSELLEGVKFSIVELPEGEDINSMVCNHDNKTDLLNDLLNARSSRASTAIQPIKQQEFSISEEKKDIPTSTELDVSNANKLRYSSQTCDYIIRGGVRKELDSLRISLMISSKENGLKARVKVDLYEDKQTTKTAKEIADRLHERVDLIESDLYTLTDLLEDYRESQFGEGEEKQEVIISSLEKEKCLAFLKRPNLIHNINELIGKAGVVGEENNRIFLFGISSSYKMKDTLHALIQGSSGSGKTHLLNTILELMPTEDCVSLTRVTESSFYNYGEYELSHKLIGIEDFDGLEEKAQLAFRELQSKGMISSSTSGKDEKTGEIKGYVKKVFGPISSLSATTQGEVYEDNMSRCFLVAVDESQSQTLKIIDYQNSVATGAIKKEEQKETKDFLQNCIRLLKNEKVINPYAGKINLPPQAHKIRRLNDLFQIYVRQVTLLNQYQRSRVSTGDIITSKEDIITAIDIMFESILLKVDELDGSLRHYYEALKGYVKAKGANYEFSRIEIRQALNIGKSQQHRYMEQLIDLEYIHQEGYANRGYRYKIAYWDNNEKLRTEIRKYLLEQVEAIKEFKGGEPLTGTLRNTTGTPDMVLSH